MVNKKTQVSSRLCFCYIDQWILFSEVPNNERQSAYIGAGDQFVSTSSKTLIIGGGFHLDKTMTLNKHSG
jgi:hypothetical protein